MAQRKNDSAMGKGLGIGLAIAAVTAAGYYLVYGKNAPKNRKKLKGWMLKMKGEVLEQLERAKELNEDTYHTAIDKTAKKYAVLKDVSSDELAQTVKELKSHWKSIKKELADKPKKVAKKVASTKTPAKKKK